MAFITAQADGRLDFDALIASIGRLHPGTAVTVPDYYAARLASATATARAEGWPVPNPSLTCLAKSSELGWFDDASRSCEAALVHLAPGHSFIYEQKF